MDLSITGSYSPGVAVLPNIGDVEKLYDLARDRSSSARGELSRIISSILEVDVTPRESEMVADVLIKLMRQAEKDLRKAVSMQIASIDNAPLRLVLQLANDEVEVAEPVLRMSNVLGDFDLMYIIKSKTSEYWQIIAKRENLNAQVIDLLADTKDFDTALALVKNENIVLTEHALTTLSDLAQDSDVLAIPLIKREEVPDEIVAKIYKYVGEEVKSFIDRNYDISSKQEIFNIIDNIVDEFISPASAIKGFMPDDYMVSAAKKFKAKGMLNMSLLLNTLRLGHIRSFVAQFSVYTNLPVDFICSVLSQTDGQGLAIISKASGIKKQDFISIFMLSSRIWNQGRLADMNDVQSAISYYNNVKPDVANDILKMKVIKEK